jgi:hypothetical protein
MQLARFGEASYLFRRSKPARLLPSRRNGFCQYALAAQPFGEPCSCAVARELELIAAQGNGLRRTISLSLVACNRIRERSLFRGPSMATARGPTADTDLTPSAQSRAH